MDELQQARLMLNRYVGRDLSLCLNESDVVLDQVVEAVLAEWQPGADVAALWEGYANKVERPCDGSGDRFRSGFDWSFGPDGTDVDGYLQAVWLDHLSQVGKAKAA